MVDTSNNDTAATPASGQDTVGDLKNVESAEGSVVSGNQDQTVTGEVPVMQSSDSPSVQVPEMLKPVQGQPSVTNDERIWGLVSYIPLLALMALVLKPSSEFIRLHGRQGLLIFLIFFFSIFVYLVPYIGPVIGGLIHFSMIGIGVFSMYQAFIGNWWKIPILGDIAELIPVEMFAKVTREAVVGAKVAEEIEQQSRDEQEAKVEKAAIASEIVQEVQTQLPIEGENGVDDPKQ